MSNGDTKAGQLDDSFPRKSAPFKPVYIPRNSRHRSDGLELLDNGLLADVAGMQDMIDATQMLCDRRIEQSMGISNDTDAAGTYAAHGSLPGWTPSAART